MGDSRDERRLIAAQRDRHQSMQLAEHTPRQHPPKHTQPRIPGGIGHGKPRQRPNEHHPFHAQIQHAGALCDQLTHRCKQQRRSCAQSRPNNIYQKNKR